MNDPESCMRALLSCFDALAEENDTKTKLTAAVTRYSLRALRETAAQSFKDGSSVQFQKDAVQGAILTHPSATCFHFFGGQLRAQDPRAKKTYFCTNGARCKYTHTKIASLSRIEKQEMISHLPLEVQKVFTRALIDKEPKK